MYGRCSLSASISRAIRSPCSDSGSGPSGDSGRGGIAIRVCVSGPSIAALDFGRKPWWRRSEHSAMNVPVRPTPAEHPATIGGSGSRSPSPSRPAGGGAMLVCAPSARSRFAPSTSFAKCSRAARSPPAGTPWSGHAAKSRCWNTTGSPAAARGAEGVRGWRRMTLCTQCAASVVCACRRVTSMGTPTTPS
ncbi:hypothetical protein GSI_06034 [Ganoderma sinense ZZ0214-1]|uniref:Uncharacterized protein n=1 Tax=Ganoderma sinense ZZ0214-1 TaxID=1077348 RepID=A0A2G8SC37_9APHY|nr:hypothetical protein GSI_06034 [Ganoderma sinense ZZ0214-1]